MRQPPCALLAMAEEEPPPGAAATTASKLVRLLCPSSPHRCLAGSQGRATGHFLVGGSQPRQRATLLWVRRSARRQVASVGTAADSHRSALAFVVAAASGVAGGDRSGARRTQCRQRRVPQSCSAMGATHATQPSSARTCSARCGLLVSRINFNKAKSTNAHTSVNARAFSFPRPLSVLAMQSYCCFSKLACRIPHIV